MIKVVVQITLYSSFKPHLPHFMRQIIEVLEYKPAGNYLIYLLWSLV